MSGGGRRDETGNHIIQNIQTQLQRRERVRDRAGENKKTEKRKNQCEPALPT